MVTVCEEIFLPTLDYDTGRPSARLPERGLRTALGGALLMDLALAARIDMDLDRLFVVDRVPTREPVLDRALASIVDDGGRRPIDRWIGVFVEYYECLRPLLVERLAERGIVLRGRDGASLVLSTHHYRDESGRRLKDVRRRLAGVLLSGEVPGPRDIVIVSLADACALWPGLLEEIARVGLAPRIAQIARMDLIGQAVARASLIERHLPRCDTEIRRCGQLRGRGCWGGVTRTGRAKPGLTALRANVGLAWRTIFTSTKHGESYDEISVRSARRDRNSRGGSGPRRPAGPGPADHRRVRP